MEVFERSKFKKIYILERENKIIDYAFTPFTSKRKSLKSMVKKSSICAVPPPSRYKTDCYDYSISKILICDGDKYIEVYSQSEPGFVTLLIYYLLNKNKLWKSNLKIKICKRVYEDYYFDNEDIYELPSFLTDLFNKLNENNLIYLSYLISTCTYHRIDSLDELRGFERADTNNPYFNIERVVHERFKLLTSDTCLYECASLEGIRLTDKFIRMYNSTSDVAEKVKWVMYFNIFAGFDELLLYRMYQFIFHDECLNIEKMIDYFE